MKSIFKPIKNFFKVIIKLFDKKIVVPITKLFLWVYDKFNNSGKKLERILMMKNTLIFLSLILAVIFFVLIDSKSISMIQTSAEVLYDQPITTIYNEESYVIEGLPEAVDITLIGRTSDLYLAKQIPSHEVTVDLTGLKPGTHKVKLKYKRSIGSIDYKIDPSVATIVIYPKISKTTSLSVDLLNQDNLDDKLLIKEVDVDIDEVIIKGAEHQLSKVASIKAMVNIDNIVNPEIGETILRDIPLIAYNKEGKPISIEIVPAKVNAKITITSPSKEVPIRIIPKGNVVFGKAISTIITNINKVTIYGDDELLEKIAYIPVEIDVNNLNKNKDYIVTMKKPVGVKSMNLKTVNVSITLGQEITKEISGINIEHRNLNSNLNIQALSEIDVMVTVIIKGVEEVVNTITKDNIIAYLDLKDYGVGEYEVEIKVEGTDLRLIYTPKVKKAKIIINEK